MSFAKRHLRYSTCFNAGFSGSPNGWASHATIGGSNRVHKAGEIEVLFTAGVIRRSAILMRKEADTTAFERDILARLPEAERWRCVTEDVLLSVVENEHRRLKYSSLIDALQVSVLEKR